MEGMFGVIEGAFKVFGQNKMYLEVSNIRPIYPHIVSYTGTARPWPTSITRHRLTKNFPGIDTNSVRT